MNALEVKNLVKYFDKVKAVDDVSFDVPQGSIFGLIGRNGAGKTTTIRMMMNIYSPDKGEVLLRGEKVDSSFRNKVGYLPEERGLYKKMRVLDTLMFFAEIKSKTGKEIEKRAKKYLEQFDLKDRMQSKIEDLSKGNQQKIQFIATILHDPEFIILDEPFSGLDPINTNLLKEIILEKKSEGKVIIFSTHLMDFAEKMCDHVAMIDKGKIILDGSLSQAKAKFAQRNVSDFGNTTQIKLKEASYSQDLLKALVEKNVTVKQFNANDISLHEIFVQLAGKVDGEILTAEVTNV